MKADAPDPAEPLAELEPGYLRLYFSALRGEKEFWTALFARGGRIARAASSRLASAERLRREARWAEALKEIRAAFRLSPGLPAAHALRAKTIMTRAAASPRREFLRLSRAALEDCRRAVRDPECGWVYGLAGLAHCGAGTQQEIYRRVLEASRRRPRRPELLSLLVMHEFSGDARKCADHLARALRLRPDDLELRAFRGELARREGRFNDALEDLDRTIAGLPGYDRAYLWRSKVHRARGDQAQARRDLDQALRLEPLHPAAHFENYLQRLESGNLPAALEALDGAVEAEGRCPWNEQDGETSAAWRHLRFKLLCRMKDYARAWETLNTVHALDSKYTWSWGDAEPRARSIPQLDEAVARFPDSAWLRAWRGRTWLSLGESARAENDLDEAVRLDGRPGLFHLWRAELRLREGALASCLDELRRAEALGAPAASLHGLWAEAELQRSSWSSALSRARRAERACPTAVGALLSRSRALAGLGRREEALRAARRAHDLAPGDPATAALVSELAGHDRHFPFDLSSLRSADLGPKAGGLSPRRLKSLRADFSAAIRRELRSASKPALGKLYAKRGWAAFCAGLRREALADVEQALALDPSNAVYRVWRGAIRKSGGEWNAALEDFSAAIALAPGAVMAFFGRAEVRRNLGLKDDALEDARKVAELQPQSAAAWRFLAKHRPTPEAAPAALEDLDRALALDARSAEGHAWRGEILRLLGREPEALKSFARALRCDPRYELAYLWRAALRSRRGELDGALADLSRAARLNPGNPRTQALRGRVLRDRNRPAPALKAFDRALALDPSYAWAAHERFLLHGALGRWREALRDLDRAHALDEKYGWFEAHASARPGFDGALTEAVRRLEGLAANELHSSASVWLDRVRAIAAERAAAERAAADRPLMEDEKSYDVMLGYACNILCKFCSQDLDWRKDGWLPLAAAREQVYLAYQRGARILNLLGGEVTVYPDVLALVSFAKKLGFQTIQFETNGIRLADRAFAQALFDAGLTRVSVSVHASTAAVHDRLVKAPGAFEKLLKGMDHLNELGITIRTAFVLNRGNFRDVEAFCRYFWTEKEVAEFQFIYPLYTGDFMNHLEEMAVPVSEVVPELEKAFALLEKLGCPKPPNIHNIPPCFFPSRLSQMGDWQDVGMEVLKPDGKRYQDTPATPLYRKVYAESCSRCSLRERCVGVDPAYLRRWGEGEIKPVLGAIVSSPVRER